jgi:cytochrome c55X
MTRRLLLLFTALLMPIAASAAVASERKAEIVHMLRQDCGACHGMRLKGGLGPPLLPQTLAGKDPETLAATILYGRPNTPMPPWNPFLNQEEARWLVKILMKGDVPNDAP